MAIEKILSTDINRIKNDEYYLFYEMMVQSLRTDNVKEGIHSSLLLLRTFLESGHISLYKKNEEGKYVFKLCDSSMDNLILINSKLVNRTKTLTETNGIFNIDLNLSEELGNLMLIHFRIDDDDSILSILNYNQGKKLEAFFWEKLKETIAIILKRAASYARNVAAITTDLLTGLDNRNSYEMRLQDLDESDENLVLGVFDLFSLKSINDHYGHIVGDEYIKGVAKILNNYWQKQIIKFNYDGTELRIDTGHCVYRFGGDEFVLLTNVDSLQYANVKASLAKLEANKLHLTEKCNMPIGVNYGIVKHTPGDSIKKTFAMADELMEEDKKKMYLKYGIERRR